MPNSTCSIQDCGKRKHSRGWCSAHYSRWKRKGDPMVASTLAQNKGAECAVDGCTIESHTRGYCKNHYARYKATGSPLRPCKGCGKDCPLTFGPKVYCSEACIPACGVPDCERRVSGRSDYCKIHHDGIGRYGRLPVTPWADEKLCVVCGKTDWAGKGRKTCSANCRAILSRNDGIPPKMWKQCLRCTTIIDLSVVHESGRKARADVQICRACWRAKYKRHRTSVTVLADRDGTECGICSGDIDMSLQYPELMRASVDHILPYASGGTHDAANLQLAHLRCNLIKQNRPGFVM